MKDIDTDNGVMEYLFTSRFVGFSANSILGSLLQSIEEEIDYILYKVTADLESYSDRVDLFLNNLPYLKS